MTVSGVLRSQLPGRGKSSPSDSPRFLQLLSSIEGIWVRFLQSVHPMDKGGWGITNPRPHWSTLTVETAGAPRRLLFSHRHQTPPPEPCACVSSPLSSGKPGWSKEMFKDKTNFPNCLGHSSGFFGLFGGGGSFVLRKGKRGRAITVRSVEIWLVSGTRVVTSLEMISKERSANTPAREPVTVDIATLRPLCTAPPCPLLTWKEMHQSEHRLLCAHTLGSFCL